MPVVFAANGTTIERDHIYVSQPGTEVAVREGKLRVEKKNVPLPIDLLFSTLAEDQRGQAIAVVLSGSASDGALGTKAVKAEGGITFAQDDTAFFRDPEVFQALRDNILPRLMQDRVDDSPIRVWVPGCATGEEVYSLAISLLELVHDRSWTCPIQIFGTDISDAAIDAARAG